MNQKHLLVQNKNLFLYALKNTLKVSDFQNSVFYWQQIDEIIYLLSKFVGACIFDSFAHSVICVSGIF